MTRALVAVSVLAIAIGQAAAQNKTGAIVIYRQWGARVGFLHYAQGVHPALSCDSTNVAKMAEGRETTVSAVVGTHTCTATEKQYPGQLNADSDTVQVDVRPGSTIYLRLLGRFGRVHFVLEEVPTETGSAEAEKMKPVSDKDSYATILSTNSGKPTSDHKDKP